MKLKFLVTILLCIVTILSASSSHSQTEELSQQQLYNLCSKFPFNSRCRGQNIPIPLKERSGSLIHCSLKLNNPAKTNECKAKISDTGLTIYYEVGDPIELLDNQRASQEFTIPSDKIFAFNLRVWQREGDTTSFFLGGSLYVLKDENYRGFEGDFNPATNSDERGGFGDKDFAETEISFVTENSETESHSNILRITSSEDFGAYLRDQLDQKTTNASRSSLIEELKPSLTAISSSDQASQIQQLLKNKVCIRCNLRGADLSKADLEDANLEGANLQDAKLSEANLKNSYLIGANLSGAVLTSADLSNARADLASFSGANLEKAKINTASLQFVDLTGANLSGTRIGGTNLEGVNLENATLTNANLSRLTSTDFMVFLGLSRFKIYTNLGHANLSGANLSNANLEHTQFDDANLKGANLTGAKLNDADLNGANLCGATMADGAVSNQGCQ
jgi:uncharacterized protein YjbI with pentapeptide repeats